MEKQANFTKQVHYINLLLGLNTVVYSVIAIFFIVVGIKFKALF